MKRVGSSLIVATAISWCFGGLLFANTIQTLNLTTNGSSGTIGSAFFQQIDSQATGTGVISPFLSIQNKGTEKGYNTDGKFEPSFNMKRGGNPGEPQGFTRSLQLYEVPVAVIDGNPYRQFLLDINESKGNGGALISLDQLKIYQADSPDLKSFGFLQSSPLIYDMDANSDYWVGLDASLNPGSGAGDMFVYIPVSLFSSSPYVYLYSQFGSRPGWGSSGGFEEWAVLEKKTPAQTPEPASLLLLATGIAGIGLLTFRIKR